MAYRFLLEVPDSLAAEANVAVGEAGDAQIVVVRPHGQSFDEPYIDLTVAAHTLQVIDTVYRWFDGLGASRPDIRLVLHSGERVSLESHDRLTMVAAIRRDQPWVERTVPKIGEHEVLDTSAAIDRLQADAGATQALATTPTEVASSTEPRLQIRALNHIGLITIDLPRAERFYTEFLAMELVGRALIAPDGSLSAIEGPYSWDQARATGNEADVTFLRNGPLTLALHRVGRGARLERSLLDHISIRVDAATFTDIKGQVLMRSYEMIASAPTAFMFRDPYGIIWEMTLRGPAEVF